MIRTIFSTVVIIHGLTHVIAFGLIQKANDTTELRSLSDTTVDLYWILPGLALIFTAILFVMKKPWLTAGAVSILLSQALIILHWDAAKNGTLINLILAIALIIFYHEQKFNDMVRSEVNEIFGSQLHHGKIITKESLRELPPVIQKWLVRSNILGKPMIHTVHLTQKGMMRGKPEARWMYLTAEQFINADNPGFIWNAVIDTGFFMNIQGRDKYYQGSGNMLIKALYTIPVADSRGKEIDQGTLMRYLAEIVWFPTAALSGYIRWEYVSETSARVVIEHGGTAVSGVFSFDGNGDIKGFEGMRYRDFDDRYSLDKWSVAIKDHKEFDGIRIGNKSEVTWKLESGDFTWLTVEITDIKFNFGDNTVRPPVKLLPFKPEGKLSLV